MRIYQGVRLYAVDSREFGTIAKAKRFTVKIYDGSCANMPRATLSGEHVVKFRNDVPAERDAIERYLRTFLPWNDPYLLKESNDGASSP